MVRALLVQAHGGVDALRIVERPEPSPGPGEVLVEMHAVGVNHLDLWVRRGVAGAKFPLPLVLGSDGAGVVRAVGAGVGSDTLGVKVGAEVVIAPATSCGRCEPCAQGHDYACEDYAILGEHRDGLCAERVVVPAANVVDKPTRLSFVEAAAVGIPFLTAWHMLVARAALRPGETVLVQAAGSGVSTAAIQIAKLLGATVIAVASSDAKRQRAKALGADHVLATTDNIGKVVKELTGGRGCEVVFEHVGAATWEASSRALAWHGRMVLCGATAGHEVTLNLRHLFFKAQSILGSTMGSRGEFHEVLRHAGAGRLRPVVDRTLPLDQAALAHQLLEDRAVFGKIVLLPQAPESHPAS